MAFIHVKLKHNNIIIVKCIIIEPNSSAQRVSVLFFILKRVRPNGPKSSFLWMVVLTQSVRKFNFRYTHVVASTVLHPLSTLKRTPANNAS